MAAGFERPGREGHVSLRERCDRDRIAASLGEGLVEVTEVLDSADLCCEFGARFASRNDATELEIGNRRVGPGVRRSHVAGPDDKNAKYRS